MTLDIDSSETASLSTPSIHLASVTAPSDAALPQPCRWHRGAAIVGAIIAVIGLPTLAFLLGVTELASERRSFLPRPTTCSACGSTSDPQEALAATSTTPVDDAPRLKEKPNSRRLNLSTPVDNAPRLKKEPNSRRLDLSTPSAILSHCSPSSYGRRATPPKPVKGRLPSKAALRRFAHDYNRAALALYRRLRQQKPTVNAAVSPYSVLEMLAVTSAQMPSTQRRALFHALKLASPHHTLAGLHRWLVSPQGRGRATLSLSNRLWLAPNLHLSLGTRRLSDLYGADVMHVDFAADPARARRVINGWVATQTNWMIRHLVPPSFVQSDTKMIITNTVYFKGKWAFPFKVANTRLRYFDRPDQPSIRVMAMHNRHLADYAGLVTENTHLLSLSLGSHQSMLLLIPAGRIGRLPALERGLTARKLERWIAKLSRWQVTYFLPRFAVRGRATGEDLLTATQRRLAPPMLHQARVLVNEQGAVAAAATVSVGISGPPPRYRQVSIRFNRPFLYLIRDNTSGMILFIGRVGDPSHS